MPSGYTHLIQEQRYEIETMHRNKFSWRSIVANLGVFASTLCSELRRNKGEREYLHKQAQSKYKEHNRRQDKALKFKGELLSIVEDYLCFDLSPEQISYDLLRTGKSISHERIYQHIWSDKIASGKLHQQLRNSRKKNRKRGHVKEFSNHETIAKSLSAETYFCHPYHSWERGTNENANGLIRQYFPKKREFLSVEDDELTEAMRRIDNRPRKILGWKTPIQVFTDNYKSVALQC